MSGSIIKHYLGKLVKPLMIGLPLNLLAALLYCMIAKKMTLASYSTALLFVGGVYAAIGGMSFMGSMDAGSRSTMIWRGDTNQKKYDDAGRDSFRISGFIIGIVTILISYVLTFW